jgi:hypothetical protein
VSLPIKIRRRKYFSPPEGGVFLASLEKYRRIAQLTCETDVLAGNETSARCCCNISLEKISYSDEDRRGSFPSIGVMVAQLVIASIQQQIVVARLDMAVDCGNTVSEIKICSQPPTVAIPIRTETHSDQ